MTITKYIGICLLLILSIPLLGQQRKVSYNISMETHISKEKQLSFWQRANHYGIVPEGTNGILQGGFFSNFTGKHRIDFSYGLSAAGYTSKDKSKIILDQAYLSAKWQKLRLDLGMIRPANEYNGISSTNGNIVHSNNARNLPGYNLHTDFIKIPLTKNVLSFKFNLADYIMLDDRFVDKTLVHNKSLFVNIKLRHRMDITIGVEHWAEWAGKSPIYGKQPSSFRDYVKVFFARGGGEGATVSDSINALGNHLGREHIQINYRADNYTLTFYHDIPFEDGSGAGFANFPDGVYGFYWGSKNKKQWLSDIMYEFYYTKSQSGRNHDRPATPEEKAKQDPHSPGYGRVIVGGNDDYFNNSEYKSGWTYYGQCICTPFITPKAAEQGITLGVYNNRILAHYLGLQGYIIEKIPYKFMFSYSLNYGRYSKPLTNTPKQFSLGLEAGIWHNEKAPFLVDVGIFGDFGDLLKHNFGFSVKLSRNKIIK